MDHREKRKQSRETVTKEAKTLGLLDKDIRSAIINMFKELKRAMSN